MRRREVVAGLAGMGAVGAGGWLALSAGEHDGRLDPVTVEAIDAPGSEAGRTRVPAAGTATVIDLFATWCGPCTEQMDELRAVHTQVGEDARFVSVTNEALGGTFTRDDLRAWWREQEGRWTVAHDSDGALTRALGAPGLPFVAVVGPDRRLRWTHHGVASAGDLIERVREVVP